MEELFRITRIRRENAFEMKHEHYHNFYEFYYQVSGERKFFLNGRIYHVRAGEMMLIPKREIHRTSYYRTDTGRLFSERIAICFGDGMVENLQKEIGQAAFEQVFDSRHLAIPLNRTAYLKELLGRMLTEYKGMDEFSVALCRRYLEELILFLIRCQRHDRQMEGHGEQTHGGMEEAAQYISAHFGENITLPFMAQKYCVSPAYFSRQFKEATGFGFKEYLNTVRIRHACELLLSTDKNITQVAAECGYMDSNYFGDAFRRAKNVSPREYRKTNVI